MIYADVYQPPKSASYFNQLPADLFDLATGKGSAAARSRKRLNESPSAIWGGGSRLVACLCYADDTMMQTRRRLLTTLSLARAVDHGNAGLTLVGRSPACAILR